MVIKNMMIKNVKAATIIFIIVAFVFLGSGICFAADEKPRFIAHGGGFIEGYYTTNSVEAVLKSIADGYTLIELDMCYSRDDKIIMIHDWERTVRHYFGNPFARRPSEREFEQLLVNGRFQTLTFNRLVRILDEAEDVRIVTDVKGDNIKVLTMIAEQYPDYMDRMIPQIYSYEEYDIVKELGYDDIILTLYAMPEIDYDELLRFIRSHDLFAVAVGDSHDYTFGNLMAMLAGDGALVYYHPANDFETAIEAMEQGAYGVYAGKIVPADFEEPARSYYLLEERVKLGDLTLEEKTFAALRNVLIKNGAGKTITYFVDGEPATDELIADLEEGRHELKVILELDEKILAGLDYLLWSGEGYLRILDKRYEYRMNEFRKLPDMRETLEALEEEVVSGEIRDILLNSLVVKAGEYYGYNDGEILIFRTNEEFLYTQRHLNGSVISPFADCITALGADSVRMDEGRFMYVRWDGVRTMMQANTSFISQGVRSSRLNTPLTIYRDRTMAAGEVYKMITGRDYIDNREFMILLPENAAVKDLCADEIFSAASLLFTLPNAGEE